MCCLFFFFKQKTAYEMRISDWSSDVCSSDLQSASSTNLTTRSSAAARVPAMKIDGGLGGDLRNAGKAAASQEAQGYDGVWTAETSHDPFFPLLLASQHTEKVELGTGIAVAFARNPMNLASIAYDLQARTEERRVGKECARKV